jgi:CRP-like cAMP-binding protein
MMNLLEIIIAHPESKKLSLEKGLLDLDFANYVYGVVQGVVITVRRGVILRSSHAGKLLVAEIGEKGKEVNQNTCMCLSQVELVALPRNLFWDLCKATPEMKQVLLSELDANLREVDFRLLLLRQLKRNKLILWLIRNKYELRGMLRHHYLSYLSEYLGIKKSLIREYLSYLERKRLLRVVDDSVILTDLKGLELSLKIAHPN